MKKIIIFLFLSIMTLGAQSQIIERHGDRYTVDGVVYSHLRHFVTTILNPIMPNYMRNTTKATTWL